MSEAHSHRLDGWKAIADHLGRDPRTAQRWHQARGMPVHHVPGSSSGAVFAYRGELDDWLARGTPATPAESNPPVASIPPPGPAPDTQSTSQPLKQRRRVVIAGIAAAVFLAGFASLALITTTPGRQRPAPTQLRLEGFHLSATDAGGDVAWTFSLARAPGVHPNRGNLEPRLEEGLPVDLDGDGTIELVAIIHYAAPTGGPIQDVEVYCLSAEGTLLWTYRPRRSLVFAGREFVPPWRYFAVAATPPPGARLWLSFIDRTWWPSFVVSLGADGSERLEFVNAGHIGTVQSLETGSERLMLAGGFNNEFMMPAMAAFPDRSAGVVSPQTAGTPFECTNCPSVTPSRYLLFPRSEVNRALGEPFVAVMDIEKSVDAGILEVSVRQPERGLRTIYRFAADLTPLSVGFSDAYWAAHRDLSKTGTIDHPLEACPEREGAIVRVWQKASGWTDVRVSPMFAWTQDR